MSEIFRWALLVGSSVALIGVGCLCAAVPVLIWKRRQAKELRHNPLARDMLRGPGYSLRRKLDDLDTDLMTYAVCFMVSPLVIYTFHISNSYFLGKQETTHRVVADVVVLIIGMAILGWRLLRILEERKIAVLGLEGEISTAQELDQLMLEGCRVFHDIPTDYGNIDHVVVSGSGVYAVNTKCLQKPKQGNDKAIVVVDHNNNCVRFPDRDWKIPNDQFETESNWLSKHLSSATAENIKVEPMMALPGWFIEKRIGRGPVYVFNPVKPKRFFVQKRTQNTPKQVPQIAHQLEQLCRDVERSFFDNPKWNSDKRD